MILVNDDLIFDARLSGENYADSARHAERRHHPYMLFQDRVIDVKTGAVVYYPPPELVIQRAAQPIRNRMRREDYLRKARERIEWLQILSPPPPSGWQEGYRYQGKIAWLQDAPALAAVLGRGRNRRTRHRTPA